jgi:hypothetical protein
MSSFPPHFEERKDPSEFTPEANAVYTREYNRSLREFVIGRFAEIDIQKVVQDFLGSRDGVSVGHVELVTVGSDGREEKGPASPLESILLLDVPGYNISSDLFGLVDAVNHGLGDLKILDPTSEVKNLALGNVASYRAKAGDFFPSRVIDSVSLTPGEAHLVDRSKILLADEIVQNQRDMLRRKKDRMKKYARTAATGKTRSGGEDLVHFDLDRGEAFLNREQYVNGFKYGPLRFVQTWIMMQVIRVIAESTNPRASVFDVPANIADKLQFLQSGHFIDMSQQQVQDATFLYHYFLWLYHRSEYAFKHHGDHRIFFDSAEVRTRLQQLLSILPKSS